MSARLDRVRDLGGEVMYEFALALDSAGFNARIIKKIIESKDGEYAKLMRAALADKLIEGQFKLLTSFDVVVPEDYDPKAHLDDWRRFDCNQVFRSRKDYPRTAFELLPGQKFKARIFRIEERVSSEDCLAKLCSENAVLAGAQGLRLVYEHFNAMLPTCDYYTVSFGPEESLLKVDGAGVVPVATARCCTPRGNHYLSLTWSTEYCLLSLTRVE